MEKGLTFFHKGEYDAAAEELYKAVMEDPQSFEAMYNLACCYSMLSEKDEALKFLHRAAQLAPQCVDWAKEDREFDPIREDPVFQDLLQAHNLDKSDDPQPSAAAEPVEEDEPETVDAEEAYEEFEDVMLEEPAEYEPVASPAQTVQPGAQSTPMPQTIKKAAKKAPEPSPFPPCASCGGIIEMERRSKHSVVMILVLLWVGTMFCISIFLNSWGMVGFPVIMLAFYLLMQTREIWVCQNCGAAGADCGQPPR